MLYVIKKICRYIVSIGKSNGNKFDILNIWKTLNEMTCMISETPKSKIRKDKCFETKFVLETLEIMWSLESKGYVILLGVFVASFLKNWRLTKKWQSSFDMALILSSRFAPLGWISLESKVEDKWNHDSWCLKVMVMVLSLHVQEKEQTHEGV